MSDTAPTPEGLLPHHPLPERAGSGPSEDVTATVLDRAGDLDHTTERLQRTEQDLLAEYERNAALLATIGTGAEQVTGRGSAADGAVVVETDAANRMTDLELDPRALRLGSIANLRRAILDAYEAAAEDAASQVTAAGLGGVDPEPLRGLLEAMPEVSGLLPDRVWDGLLAPTEATTDDDDDDSRWTKGDS